MRNRRRAFAERALHHHRVEPATEFEADIAVRADHLKTRARMHADRSEVGRIADHRDHHAIAALFCLSDQRLHQPGADPLALCLRVEIDRVLDCESIGRARPVGPCISIADHDIFHDRYQIGEAAFRQRLKAPRHLGEIERFEFECRGAMQNRFTSVVSNLQSSSENLSASRSRIQDADFASESATLTRGQILPQAILDIPRYGCLNVHGSILPLYRGAAPIHWAILNGDAVTGVTVMKMDVGMDTGDILSVVEEKIEPEDTTDSLYARLKLLGAELLVTTLERLIQGEIVPYKQDETRATYTKLITRDMEKIDWQAPAENIHNKIRALAGAYTCDTQGAVLKIWRSSVCAALNNENAVGSVSQLNKKGFIVQAGVQAVQIEEVQPANRKRMTARDYANGHKLKIGEQFF